MLIWGYFDIDFKKVNEPITIVYFPDDTDD